MRRWIDLFRRLLAAVVLGSLWAGVAHADKTPMIVRVYPVGDLVVSAPSYPFFSIELPTMSFGPLESRTGTGLGGGFGGGGGGGGGFGGGAAASGGTLTTVQAGPAGFANINTPGGQSGRSARAARTQTSLLRVADLAALIESVIDPDQWEDNGGQGVVKTHGTLLVIQQSSEAHEKISNLLVQMRKEWSATTTYRIAARWLLVDDEKKEEVHRILAEGVKQGEGKRAAALHDLARLGPGFGGEITCFDRQTVHIASGQGRTVLAGAQPTISAGAVAYDPKLVVAQTGATLEVTPARIGASEVVLDLHNIVSRIRPGDGPAILSTPQPAHKSGENSAVAAPPIGLDRVDVLAQEFSTTLRMALGKPAVAGGFSLEPESAGDDGSEGRTLLLLLEVTEAAK